MEPKEHIKAELVVIGRGLAGMAAALFSANRGVDVVQVGRPGETQFASGLMDLMGIHPLTTQQAWRDPWAAIAAITQDIPGHPYGHLPQESIAAALDEIFLFLKDAGLPYRCKKGANSEVLTPLGSLKSTYGVPAGMWNGVQAWEAKTPCLLVDFLGLPDFSARQMASMLRDQWPGLRAIQIPFPDNSGNGQLITGEILALSLEDTSRQQLLAENIGPHLKDAGAVGFPAVLGMYGHRTVMAALEALLGVPCFEIPTLPVSVPGLRLSHAFARGLAAKGVQQLYQHEVGAVGRTSSGDFLLDIHSPQTPCAIQARGVVLASGRFLGGGLATSRHKITETIFNLPVSQPGHRGQWHRRKFLDPQGHPVNQAGLEIDDRFRPLDPQGQPVDPNLMAAGAILAHQDWIRMGCGAGLAFASAYGAVNGWASNHLLEASNY